MFFLTFSLILKLGISRFIAVQARQISIKYYQKYTDGQQPDRLHILNRHIQNHFEVPPLFYVGAILLFVTDSVSQASLIFAWSFFALRCIHTMIHLGKNDVNHRFFCFGASLLSLAALWVCLILGILK